jgi:hypothetical protein
VEFKYVKFGCMHEKSREFLIKWISFFLLHGFWFFIEREVEFEKVDRFF